MKQRLHPVEILLMLTAALLLTSGAVALHTQSELADKVVRLHVLANSDSGEDQALKLKVRDAVLAQASETLRTATTPPPLLWRRPRRWASRPASLHRLCWITWI